MKRVVVGMSGGVDSSVAAYLLKKEGYEVIGITMQIWQQETEGGCCGLSAIGDARRVAAKLGIPYYVMNFRDIFKERVMNYFVQEYIDGRTPNPCIACNRYIKWEALLRKALGLGAEYIATGHYARILHLDNGRYTLKKSVSEGKDQTYALYNLTQEQLSRTLMPAGDYTKEEIRQIAEEIGLLVANKPDSQEICFVPDHDYASFVEDASGKKAEPGNFVSRDGTVLGRHKGIIHYTVGQRKGLGLSMGHPVFVSEIRPQSNEVVIGETEDILKDTLYAENLNFMSIEALDGEMEVEAKIRYNHKGAPARIWMEGNGRLKCVFHEPQRAITPGQAVVFYKGDCVAGGGTIV